jgi:Predicted membrane protein (DUF2339)
MEGLILLLAGLVLAIPVIAIVAMVRSRKVRQLLEESNSEHRREIDVLRGEVANFRRELSQLKERVSQQGASAHPGQTATEPLATTVPAIKTSASKPVISEPPAQVIQQSPLLPTQPPATPRPIAAGPIPLPPVFAQARTELPSNTSIPLAPFVTTATAVPVPTRQSGGEASPRLVLSDTPPPATTYSHTETRATHSFQAPAPSFPSDPPRKTFAERLRSTLPFEELLGMNLFAKIGIALLVLGFALLGRMALISMDPGQRVALIYAASAALLGGGIWLERKERYRLIGRAGFGGGWALLFFTTYAMHHVSAMAVLASNTLDCVLMLLVAFGMVAHTLRYKSQVVTGLAFLLAFSTVALSQDSVYALVAGVILALGIVAIALRMKWYELEVFGILASYANHFYWLYKLYPGGFAGHAFPQFWASAIILLLYWAVFRISFIVRIIRSPRDESISSLAALINIMSLGAVMKFQSTRPELAFYALLALGAVEFFCGQLPPCRHRPNAFRLLTVVGTILMFASVPFKFSGNSIALFWMIGAELLLIAGIIQAEVVFRRLGLIAGTLTGLLVIYEARSIIELRQHSESPLTHDGILLLTVSLLFAINAQFIRRKWDEMFGSIDASLATAQGYLGAITAIFGVWTIFTADWTVLGWATLFLAAVYGKRRLHDNHLMVQAWTLAGLVLFRCAEFNCHVDIQYPHHVAARFITLPILAAVFFAAGRLLSGVDDRRVQLRVLSLWAGTVLLAVLAWLDISQTWVAPAWVAFAVVLALIARRIRLPHFNYQQHVLAVAAVAQLVAINLDASKVVERYIPILACAGAFYAISRFCTMREASYSRFAAWTHTWGATALLAALAWHESQQAWLAVIWALFAITLAVVDRIFTVEELPYQAHVLTLLAVVRAVTLNLYLHEHWHGIDLRLITVSILVAVLYALARWVRLPESLRTLELRHAYNWVASVFAAWMMWGEVKPVGVAVAWAVFGLLLFEIGSWQQQKQLRFQGFGLLIAAFIRIFFVNLTANAAPGEALSPRIYTIVPMVLIYFYVWTRLRPDTDSGLKGWSAADLIAYFGTGCVAALLYFEVAPEWIIVAWAVLALALIAAALLLDRSVFLQQSTLLVAGIVARSFAHNIFGASYFTSEGWRGKFSVVSITAALLLSALPLAFRLHARYKEREVMTIERYLGLQYPEQFFFFAPMLLISVMIAVRMNPGMVTLSWGIEGVAVILLGLLVTQRSYRLTGLVLLLLCVGKIVVRDAWLLGERDRYTTFIVLGAALTLVSTLYGRYRETVRKLL